MIMSSPKPLTPGQDVVYNSRTRCPNAAPFHDGRASGAQTEREITDNLLEAGEFLGETDRAWPTTIPFEVADSILAWQDVAPNAQIVIQRKKRTHLHSADDIHVRRSRSDEMNKYHKKTVESIFTSASLWRLCVEPTTYRYIPNNGRYRGSKLDHKLDRDSKLARTIRSMEKLSPEQRHLQREIQRELRQEFELQQRLDRQSEQRQRLRAAEQRRLESRGQSRTGYERTESKSEEPEKLEVAFVHHRTPKDQLFHRRLKGAVELPPINVPLKGKSVNDNFMDSFNVRIQNLEEEIKRDHWARKKQTDTNEEKLNIKNTQVQRTYSEPTLTTTITSQKGYIDFAGLPLFAEPVTEECLSVKPIKNKPGNIQNNNNNETDRGKHHCENDSNITDLPTSRSIKSEDTVKTVFIKYTTSKGDVVRVPRYTGPTVTPFAPQPSSTDQSNYISKSSGIIINSKIRAQRETGNKDVQSNSTNNNNKYVPVKSGGSRKSLQTKVYVQEDPPPVIIAEGLFSRTKDGLKTENIQVTVTQRQKSKESDTIQKGLIPGVSGKGCEVPQKT